MQSWILKTSTECSLLTKGKRYDDAPERNLPYFKGVLFLVTHRPCNQLLELLEHEILEIQSVVQKLGRSNSGVSIQPIIIALNLPFKESELIIDTAVL